MRVDLTLGPRLFFVCLFCVAGKRSLVGKNEHFRSVPGGGQLHLQKSELPSRPRPPSERAMCVYSRLRILGESISVFSVTLRAWAAITASTPGQAEVEARILTSPSGCVRSPLQNKLPPPFFSYHRLTDLVKNEQGRCTFFFNKGTFLMTTVHVLSLHPHPSGVTHTFSRLGCLLDMLLLCSHQPKSI